jgi:hypothetical protein
MFFITNRAFVEGNASAEMRKVAFELNNNEAGQSVYFCWRDDAKKAYVELGSDNFMKAMRKAATRQVLFYLHDSAQFPEEQVFPTAEKLQALFDEQDKNLVDVVPVIWPCDNGQSPMRDFHEDQIAAEASGVAVARAREKLLVWRAAVKGGAAPCLKRLNVLAHSMGNRVLRQTLSCWANYHRKGQVPSFSATCSCLRPTCSTKAWSPPAMAATFATAHAMSWSTMPRTTASLELAA